MQSGVPPIFGGLIRATRRAAQSAAAVESSSDLRLRLGAMSRPEQERELLAIVCSSAAAVLGHDSPDAVGTDMEFVRELGLDSLGAVELWNRLKSATGWQHETRRRAEVRATQDSQELLVALIHAAHPPARR